MAALLLVPPEERAMVVEAIEARIAVSYGGAEAPGPAKDERDREFVVVYPPKVRPDHIEHIERTYEVVEPKPKAKTASKTASRKRRA